MVRFACRWMYLVLWGVLGLSASGLNSNQLHSYTNAEGQLVGLAHDNKLTIPCLTPLVVPGGAVISGVGKLTKLRYVKSLIDKLPSAGGYLKEAASAGTATLRAALATTRMCFIAGTPVMTAHGLIPIEEITAGDLVWSKCEFTMEEGWKPVVDTFVTHPTELYHLAVDYDGDALADDIITGTGEHPFYLSNRAEPGFYEMRELQPSDQLVLAQGKSAQVLSLKTERGPPSETFTTYNFEVADYHTYFVGQNGVWVHNTGRSFCEKLFSLFNRFVTKANGNPWDAHGLAMQRFDGLVGLDPRLGQNSVARVQIFTEARRRHFSDLSGHTPLWRQGGQNLTLSPNTATNSQMASELRNNMRLIFKCDPEGQGFAAHHIVAHTKQGPDWDRARQVLNCIASDGIVPWPCN